MLSRPPPFIACRNLNCAAAARGCRRVLEFSPEKICLDMGSFTVTFYGAALQIESLTGKSLILTGKIRRIDFANKWGEEP